MSYPISSIKVEDCYYRITVCYKCGPGGVSTNFLKIVHFAQLDILTCTQTQFNTADELIEGMIDAILSSPVGYLGLFCSINTCCEIPSDFPRTPTIKTRFTVIKPICWRLMRHENGADEWEACESYAGCVKDIFACIRGTKIVWENATAYQLENGHAINCNTYTSANFDHSQEDYQDLEYGEWSPCFKVLGLCQGY